MLFEIAPFSVAKQNRRAKRKNVRLALGEIFGNTSARQWPLCIPEVNKKPATVRPQDDQGAGTEAVGAGAEDVHASEADIAALVVIFE